MAAYTGSLLHTAERPSAPRRGLWRHHPALMVALTYGVIGIIYIALSDQVVSFLMQHDEARVTAIQTWKGWAWIVITTFLIMFLVQHSIKEVRAAQRETLDVDARYRTMIETTNEGVVVADADKRCIYVNRTMARMLGTTPEELIGKRCGECVVEGHRSMVEQALESQPHGAPERFDCEFRRKDGSSLWTIVSASPIADPTTTGERTATLFMVTDISARKAAEQALEQNLETQRLLLNELDHRVRNNLSSLSSLIDLSKAATGSVDEFASIMSGRIQAMAKAHALAARAGNDGQDLGRVVAEMIPLSARGRVSVEGARLGIASGQIVSFALLVHELASRSLRRGSLSRNDGRAVVSWSSAAGNGCPGSVSLWWRETPAIDDSAANEHSDALIAGLVQRDLRGVVTTRRENDATVHELALFLGNHHRALQATAV